MRFFPVVIFIILFSAGCRKDLLRPASVVRMDTHTTSDRWNEILFINDSTGFIVGGERFFNAAVLKTTDGGVTWTYRGFPDARRGIYGITKTASNNLFTIGYGGNWMRSDDAGVNWQARDVRWNEYKDLAYSTEDFGTAVGGISFIAGYILQLDGKGNVLRWDSLAYELNDIDMLNPREGYICGYGVVYKTLDSMKSWQMLHVKNDNFTAVRSYEEGEVWVCGYNGSIFHSSNAGATWQKMRNGNDITIARYHLLDIAFADPQHGYAIGENGLLIYTNDGGNHWMEYERFTDVHLRSLCLRPGGDIFVAGDAGALFHVTPRP
ncbi:MAG TPA: YCF48-related protein [Flavipsychrobacter sp.]|nr:YCF48-related protein [Flavipsychrobacter sp.]